MNRFTIVALTSVALVSGIPARSTTLFQSVASFDEAGLGEWFYNRASDDDSSGTRIDGTPIYSKLFTTVTFAQDVTIDEFRVVPGLSGSGPMDLSLAISIFALDSNDLPTGSAIHTRAAAVGTPTAIPRSGHGGSARLYSFDVTDFAVGAGRYGVTIFGLGGTGTVQNFSTWTGANQSVQISRYGSTRTVEYLDGPERGVAFSIEGQIAVPSAVPEPATWAMMVAGLGVAGGMMRRRRVVSAFTFA